MKIKTIVASSLFILSLGLIFPAYANDIYIQQSGNDLDLDITQDGTNNVLGNNTTGVTLQGNDMTFSVVQTGDSNIIETTIKGNTYTGNINLTGDSSTVDLDCDAGGAGNCETVSLSIDAVGDSFDITATIGGSGDAQNFVGTIDLDNNGNADTLTFTLNAKNADLNFDMGNDGSTALTGVGAGGTTSSSSSVESGVANTVAITQSGAGDANGHSMTVDMKGGGSIANITQTGVEDKVLSLTTVGNDAKIDITQTD
jgi:hypothetical protein|tara:strand:- start:353 stop:1120 length:768 start_codon:yes stop_codon:yes gene_type:complete